VITSGVGSPVLGIVLMVVDNPVPPAFFRGRTLNRDTAVLVPEDGPLEEITPLGGA
jgi:hypothetical protein